MKSTLEIPDRRVIWKFPLKLTDVQTIMAPIGDLEPLHVGYQGDQLCLWASVTGLVELAPLKVVIVGTGHPYEADGLIFAGTVQEPPFVWHVFIAGGTE